MSTIQERIIIKEAQKIARKIKIACENNSLLVLFEGSHVETFGNNKLEHASVVFKEYPWIELQFDARENNAWVYIGSVRARIPQCAMYKLRDYFSSFAKN